VERPLLRRERVRLDPLLLLALRERLPLRRDRLLLDFRAAINIFLLP
jgi:hypothetical protein